MGEVSWTWDGVYEPHIWGYRGAAIRADRLQQGKGKGKIRKGKGNGKGKGRKGKGQGKGKPPKGAGKMSSRVGGGTPVAHVMDL